MTYIKLEDVIEILRDCEKRNMPYGVCALHIRKLPSINPESMIEEMIEENARSNFQSQLVDKFLQRILQKFKS